MVWRRESQLPPGPTAATTARQGVVVDGEAGRRGLTTATHLIVEHLLSP